MATLRSMVFMLLLQKRNDTKDVEIIQTLALSPVEKKGQMNPAEQVRAVIDAARALVKRQNEVYAEPQYLAVWTLYASHGGNYQNGPKWDKEQQALESALAALGTEPTKDDEWPRYWLRPDGSLVKVFIGRKGHHESELWNGFQWVLHGCCWPDDMFKDKGYKRLTPTEAQARMEDEVKDPVWHEVQARKILEQPAQDELQVLLERVKERRKECDSFENVMAASKYDRMHHASCFYQCLEFQRWIEEAMQKRNEVPAKVEGDEFEEWWNSEGKHGCDGYEHSRLAAKAAWHAAKAKERGV